MYTPIDTETRDWLRYNSGVVEHCTMPCWIEEDEDGSFTPVKNDK